MQIVAWAVTMVPALLEPMWVDMAEKIGLWKKNNSWNDASATYNMSAQKNIAPASEMMEYKWWKSQRGATAPCQRIAIFLGAESTAAAAAVAFF